MPIELVRRLFTAAEYHRMAEVGIFGEDDRIELLEGEIVRMSPIGRKHVACVNRLTDLFTGRLGKRAIVSIQNPVSLGDRSEPQPDVVLARPRADFYAQALPGPADVLLLVEVADTSIESDRDFKLPLYARSGIVEVWVVDLSVGVIEVYRRPSAAGYGETQVCSRGQKVTAGAFPDVNFLVEEAIGPA